MPSQKKPKEDTPDVIELRPARVFDASFSWGYNSALTCARMQILTIDNLLRSTHAKADRQALGSAEGRRSVNKESEHPPETPSRAQSRPVYAATVAGLTTAGIALTAFGILPVAGAGSAFSHRRTTGRGHGA